VNQIVKLIISALGALVGVAGVLALAFVLVPGTDQATPSTASAGPPPEFSGQMGDFSRFTPPRPVPALDFTNGTGRALDLESFRGRVVLLNLWATWCSPCVREMPTLDRLQSALGGEGFEVVALSLDRKGRDVVAPFFERLGLDHLRMYFATTAATRILGANGLPTSYLIDRRGRLVGQLMGTAEWDSPAAKALIRHVMRLAADDIESARPLPAAAPGGQNPG
jgi:thiol-disulfide isomerase/thioredoxin